MTEDQSCLICERISMIKGGTNPDFVAELETGYVVIGWHQFFYGYSIFFAKEHKEELHELDGQLKEKFLKEMSQVAEAIFRAFNPAKMNYELLGNTDRHLHWHLFPRHADDPAPKGPVWRIDPAIRSAETTKPSPEELQELKEKLLTELEKVSNITRRYSETKEF